MEVEFKKLKSTYAKVKFLLEQVPELSTDNDRLIFTFYFYELGKDKINEMSGYDVFTYFNSKFAEKTAKMETISRAKRFVLQRNPSLKKDKPQIKTLFKVKNVD
jgi:hypothetical protein